MLKRDQRRWELGLGLVTWTLAMMLGLGQLLSLVLALELALQVHVLTLILVPAPVVQGSAGGQAAAIVTLQSVGVSEARRLVPSRSRYCIFCGGNVF